MGVSNREFDEMNKRVNPPSPIFKNCCFAFLIGGLICCLGQALFNVFLSLDMGIDNSRAMVSTTLIFITGLLTGLGVFDNIAKFAGAGTIVPITGFANSIVSPAIEFKSEGWVLGVGAKMFSIAGPVLVYGITSGVIYGVIYWIFTAAFR